MFKAVEIKPGIYWVGAVDWNVRNFHGYTTTYGTTYNAYLIAGEEPVLVDTVKAPFYEEMIERIASVTDPAGVRTIVANHAEPDHAGALGRWMREYPATRVVCSKKGGEAIERHHHGSWPKQTAEEGAEIRCGGHTLKFVPIPMLHWPDSMATYVPEARLLLPNDAFGQHMATMERFDDEAGVDRVLGEAAKYYANIVMPFAANALRAIEKMSVFDFDMIAPSHGVIWRAQPGAIVERYRKWIAGEAEKRVVVVYDTMWGSTHSMALAMAAGVRDAGVPVRLFNLSSSDRSDIMKEVLEARALAIGSPTLNGQLFPTVAAFLAYMKGLRPKSKIGVAFGSYGWSGEAHKLVDKDLEAARIERVADPFGVNYVPEGGDLEKCAELGAALARRVAS